MNRMRTGIGRKNRIRAEGYPDERLGEEKE
jgi:hypothetical protein